MANTPRGAGEFDAHVAEALSMRSVRAVLVIETEAGANLNAAERKKLARAGLFDPPSAVLTDGTVGRFIMTAVRWLGAGNVSGFAVNQFAEACDFLGIPSAQRPSILTAIQQMTRELLQAPGKHLADHSNATEMTDRVKELVAERITRMREKSKTSPGK
jgi:hypothetical protein